MFAAHTLETIHAQLKEELQESSMEMPGIALPDFNIEMMRGQTSAPGRGKPIYIKHDPRSKLVGFLFCQPRTTLAVEIIGGLPYFHQRSGEFVDFFCAGYGAYWPDHLHPDQEEAGTVDDVPWLYSPKAFDEFRRSIEQQCRWKYSGETELILASVRKHNDGQAYLEFDPSIACNLELMKKDEAITSVRAFFESIFSFGEQFTGSDPVYALSDQQGIEQGKNFLKELILSILPHKKLRKLYRKASHFAIRDISKPAK